MLPKKMLLLVALPLAIQLVMLPPPPTATASARLRPNNVQLRIQVDNYLSVQGGTFGVAALDLTTGHAVFVNSNAVFPAASMYKLLVMYRIFQAIDRGELSLSDTMTIRASDFAEDEGTIWYPGDKVTVSRALWGMIAQSSNVAAYALMRQIGGPDSVALAAEELGMTSTTKDGGFWTTPADMAQFFYLLAKGQLVSPTASQEMIDLLLQQTVNDRIPALLPEGVQVAHKTGEADSVVNDGGIVFGPGGTYVLVTMSQGGVLEDEYYAEAKVSQMIYQLYGD